MVELFHPSLSFRLDTCARIFFGFIPRFNGCYTFSCRRSAYIQRDTCGDLVNFKIGSVGLALEDVFRSKVCVHVFIGVSIRACEYLHMY